MEATMLEGTMADMAGTEKYRLAALDMDGTLLNTAHETTPYTRAALARVDRAGKVVALSTGRCLAELWPHLAQNPSISYVIGESGACIYDVRRRQAVKRITMDAGDVRRILDLADRYDAVLQVFMDDKSYIRGALDESLRRYHIYDFVEVFRAGSEEKDDLRELCLSHPDRLSKINLYFALESEKRAFLGQMVGCRVVLADSIAIGVEISPAEATKARGLEALCGHLGIPIEQTMAVGDSGNDVEIMKAAGLAVAMGNAIEEVRALADVVTEDCDHDGAAKAVERYMLPAR